MRTAKVLVFVDESNVVSSVRALGRKLDWLKLRDHLASADRGRELIEMVIYAGLPPPIPEWQTEREKKNKFLHWLRRLRDASLTESSTASIAINTSTFAL